MASAQSPEDLFKQWQNGDAQAGQDMAQRFTDWYYAVTAVQLGERAGREPLQRSCTAFAQGITTIARASELVDWAHGIVAREVRKAGGRSQGGNYGNALTSQRSPSELLEGAKMALTNTQVELLAATFDDSVPLDQLIALAESHGGWPYAILQARGVLKRALRDTGGVNFGVVPDEPDLDRGPMPLYEAARMSSADEEAVFEKWLLSDLDLCRDVAEFAVFVHALRAGAFRSTPAPRPEPKPSSAPSPAPASTPAPASSADLGEPLPDEPGRTPLVWTVVAVAGVLAALGGIVWYLAGHAG